MTTLQGTPHGSVYPPAPAVVPVQDARTAGLDGLREYLSLVEFQRKGGTAFRIPIEDIHTRQPDSVEDLVFPSLVFLPSRGAHDAIGNGAATLLDESRDAHERGKALVWFGEYVETITVECWGSEAPMRVALRSALLEALRPAQESQALRLRLDHWYGLVADYLLTESESPDDPDVVRGRRRALIALVMRVPDVRLVPYAELAPSGSGEVE